MTAISGSSEIEVIKEGETMTEYRDDVEEIEEGEKAGGFGQWLQDNLRVIISVIIVLLLAVGIYSYSKRTQEDVNIAANTETDVAEEGSAEEGAITSAISDAVKAVTEKTGEAVKDVAEKVGSTVASGSEEKEKTATQKSAVAPELSDTVGDKAVTAVARPGDSRTTLARRALKAYLAKAGIDDLTGAHKVYIEDYLQKAVGGGNFLAVGESVTFDNSLIEQAINAARSLNDAQLRNLQKYANLASL